MTAILKPLGVLKEYTGGQAEMAVPAGQSVRQALDSLGIPPLLVALVMVDGAPQEKDYILQEGDVVQVLAVIGGG